MALPTTILISGGGKPGFHPPWKSSGGGFYVVVRFGTDGIQVRKADADDPADAFSEIDGTNRPAENHDVRSVHEDGNILHIATWNTTVTRYEYHTFNMGTDAWVVTNELIDSPGQRHHVPKLKAATSPTTVLCGCLPTVTRMAR